MAMIRLKPFTTTTSAAGTAGGVLTVADSSGITRNAQVGISHASGGWLVEVVKVVDATHIQARHMSLHVGANRQDMSVIPNGAVVIVEEQWVQDLYQDDLPINLAVPIRTT